MNVKKLISIEQSATKCPNNHRRFLWRIKKQINTIIWKNGKYLDQLSDKEIWVSSHKFTYYLRDTYNLTNQQYCSLVCFGDKDYVPICPICKTTPLYIDKLRLGYTNTCSHKCNSKYVANKLVSENIHNFQKENLTEELKNLHKKTMTSFSFRIKSSMSSSIKKNENKASVFYYFSEIDDKYVHLGVTENIFKRSEMYKDKVYFHSLIKLCKGSPKDIYKLEYEVKKKFADRYVYKTKRKTEYINDYLDKSSTTIEKTKNKNNLLK